MNKTGPSSFNLKIGLLTALFSGLLGWCVFFLSEQLPPLLLICIIFLLVFLFVWNMVRYYQNSEYNVRIKSIYKNILQLQKSQGKMGKEGEDINYFDEINRILIEHTKEQKEEIDQLKQLELYRKEFLGNVSHELKTPIFNVQGYIHTLIDGGIEDHDVNILYLNKASKSLDRLISIVDDLESISKIESGNLILEMRTFDICDLTRDVLESCELLAREKHINLSIKESSEKPFYVYADKDRIRQVLVNLIVNSIKYGKKDGHTEVRFYDYDDFISIEVEDNGIGIEKHHLPRLFERFYRVDKSRSRIQGGTGLGLAIVKHIIEAHQSKISALSEFGYGTTFSFTLKKSK